MAIARNPIVYQDQGDQQQRCAPIVRHGQPQRQMQHHVANAHADLQGKHAGHFLVWEAFRDYTRETITIATGPLEPGTVLQELQAGYMIKDRLLRPAMVIVAKAP